MQHYILQNLTKKYRRYAAYSDFFFIQVLNSRIYEYDAKKHIQLEREEALAEGIKQGIVLGEKRNSELTKRLLEEKRYDDLRRAAEDEGYRKKLLAELGLS